MKTIGINIVVPCKCQRCGKLYGVDIIISNKLWEKIKPTNKPTGAGLLCPECIIKKLTLIEENKMNGSEKQIAYAEDLREKRILQVEKWDDILEIPFSGGLKVNKQELIDVMRNFHGEASVMINNCKHLGLGFYRKIARNHGIKGA